MAATLTATHLACYHCGDDCPEHPSTPGDKAFCCDGCKTVYQLLSENGLCTYYDLEQNPGLKIKARSQERFVYLDNAEIANQLLDFNEGEIAKISLYIPKIHCSSCIWLLENLYKLESGIVASRVNFLKKEVNVTFRKSEIGLRRIVEVLDSFGYTPDINLGNYTKKQTSSTNRSLVYKIGIAGFCSSNIMLLSFPDYFGLDGVRESAFAGLFGYLNLALALPVIFYAASDYFVSAFKGLANKVLNLDVPIALGMAAIFLRSVYEVVLHIGPGYFDSLTGLIFFLLIGKWYQSRTYNSFSFERDYESYFPVAITKVFAGREQAVPIKDLKEGDEIIVRSNEIVPADALLIEGQALVDYSFVTGESTPVAKEVGQLIYAGGRQVGSAIRLTTQKDVSQSYLLQLWSKDVFKKQSDAYLSSFVLNFSKYFTFGTLVVALLTFAYWYVVDPSKVLFAVTSVLLVACPCALALSLPFALGNCLRLLAKHGLYLKNADTVEKLSEIDTIVFDKTGTITEPEAELVDYVGMPMRSDEMLWVKSAVAQSTHPLSQVVNKHLDGNTLTPSFYSEIPASGIYCKVAGHEVKVGGASFVGATHDNQINESRMHVAIDGEVKGFYSVKNKYRNGLEPLLKGLASKYELHLLSGDNDSEKERLKHVFPNQHHLLFAQKPADKLHYIEYLQQRGKKVMMLGDGLNDAGALKAADVGISVSEDVYNFSPACDGILEGKQLKCLTQFLTFAQSGVKVIKLSLGLSLVYNALGLYFAVTGQLSPLVAAILMPLSSVTVVGFVVLVTGWLGRRRLVSGK
jgi:P-type Cu+ transporter